MSLEWFKCGTDRQADIPDLGHAVRIHARYGTHHVFYYDQELADRLQGSSLPLPLVATHAKTRRDAERKAELLANGDHATWQECIDRMQKSLTEHERIVVEKKRELSDVHRVFDRVKGVVRRNVHTWQSDNNQHGAAWPNNRDVRRDPRTFAQFIAYGPTPEVAEAGCLAMKKTALGIEYVSGEPVAEVGEGC